MKIALHVQDCASRSRLRFTFMPFAMTPCTMTPARVHVHVRVHVLCHAHAHAYAMESDLYLLGHHRAQDDPAHYTQDVILSLQPNLVMHQICAVLRGAKD